jgi:hypothetical protein
MCMCVNVRVCVGGGCVHACMRACEGWVRTGLDLALQLPRSIVLPLLVHASINPTLLMKCRFLFMGGIRVVPWFHEVMAHLTKS